MASWVQPLDDSARRVTLPYVTEASPRFQIDGAYATFEGRARPVGARTLRRTREWTVSTVWNDAIRADAESYLTLLRDVVQEADPRLQIHLEPDNGTIVDAVVVAPDVPQQLGTARTDITVTFRQVAP